MRRRRLPGVADIASRADDDVGRFRLIIIIRYRARLIAGFRDY